MSLRTTFCKIVSMWHLGGIRFSATMMFRMFGRPPPLGVGYLYKHHEHNHFHHHLCLDHNNGNYDHDDHSDFIKVIPCGRSVGVAMSLASWGLTIIFHHNIIALGHVCNDFNSHDNHNSWMPGSPFEGCLGPVLDDLTTSWSSSHNHSASSSPSSSSS